MVSQRKRLFLGLGLTVALVLTAGFSPATASAGYSSAEGGGTSSTGDRFAFSARLGPNGSSGYAVVSNPTLGEAQGHVCAYFPQASPDNFASFVIFVEKGSGFYGSSPFIQFFAGDLGEPSRAPDLLALGPQSGCFTGGEPPIGSVIRG